MHVKRTNMPPIYLLCVYTSFYVQAMRILGHALIENKYYEQE